MKKSRFIFRGKSAVMRRKKRRKEVEKSGEKTDQRKKNEKELSL
jgi:hypothetical protein